MPDLKSYDESPEPTTFMQRALLYFFCLWVAGDVVRWCSEWGLPSPLPIVIGVATVGLILGLIYLEVWYRDRRLLKHLKRRRSE